MAKKTEKRINKSAWIRSQSKSLSAQELIAKAKKEGFALSAAQIYVARNNAKKLRSGNVGRPRNLANLSDMHRQFLALVVRIGTDEAKRLIAIADTARAPKAAVIKSPKIVANTNGIANGVGVA